MPLDAQEREREGPFNFRYHAEKAEISNHIFPTKVSKVFFPNIFQTQPTFTSKRRVIERMLPSSYMCPHVLAAFIQKLNESEAAKSSNHPDTNKQVKATFVVGYMNQRYS